MGQSSDSLHLDGVPVLQGVVQDPWRVHHLPAKVAVVQVTHKQRLGGEGVRLDFDVCPRDLVHEAGLPDVWEPAHEDGAGVGIDGGEPGEVLPHLLKVLEALVLPLHDGAHPTQRRSLQLLAAVERVAELHETYVVPSHAVDEVFGRVDLPQRQLVVVLVVQDVHEVGVERMDVVQLRELGHHRRQPVVERLLGELHLPRVELPDAGDLEVAVDDGGRLSLGLGQDNVHKVLGGRDNCYLLEVVMTHGGTSRLLAKSHVEVKGQHEDSRERMRNRSWLMRLKNPVSV